MSAENNLSVPKSGSVSLPPLIFGTSALGNLYVAMEQEAKTDIVDQCFKQSENLPVVFDSAGKYGAGLALESLGKSLKSLGIKNEDVLISNKLGWLRTELTTEEPSFEPGVWKGIKHDAVQKISYEGILECFEQGNALLGGYTPQMVSVHDPDEYLSTATSKAEEDRLYKDILEAYRALFDLKKQGKVSLVGVGAKDWKTIQRIARDIELDWIMVANSLTVQTHPADLVEFIQELKLKGCQVINSAVFNAGFLTGGDYYNYRLVNGQSDEDKALLKWRESFFTLCNAFSLKPAAVCVQFALKVPGVSTIALNTSNPLRVKENVALVHTEVPDAFWNKLKGEGLINAGLNFL